MRVYLKNGKSFKVSARIATDIVDEIEFVNGHAKSVVVIRNPLYKSVVIYIDPEEIAAIK